VSIQSFGHRAMWRPSHLAHRRFRGPQRVLRRGAEIHCPICGTRVHLEDPIGLVQARIAHAECTLIRWLETARTDDGAGGQRQRTASGARGNDAGGPWQQLLELLFSEDS
jgi:hypothetical protein